jgi:hypothetical protein
MHTGPAVRNSCLHISTVRNHVCRFQRPNTFEVCSTRGICSRAHIFIDSSLLYNIFSLPFKVHCMFSLRFPKNVFISLLTALYFQDVELLLQSIVPRFPLFCGSVLTSLLVSSPIASHNHLPEVRAVLRTCLVADSYASITMGGAHQFAVSIVYYPPSEPISRISVSSLTLSRKLDTYFHIQY